MKKYISFFLVLIIMSCSSVSAASYPTDIENHWAKTYIEKLINSGIVAGMPDGTIKPNDNIAVDQFIKIVLCSMGNTFQNDKQYWATNYINFAVEKKIIDPNEYITYGRDITREEAAKIVVKTLSLYELADLNEYIDKSKAKISDYKSINEGYENYVLSALSSGIMTGNPDGSFLPKNTISRAEAFVVVSRLIDTSLRKPALTQIEKTELLPELSKTYEELWGRTDINKLASSYMYKVIDGKLHFTDEPWCRDYVVKETVNPDLNRILYEITKVLMDDNHYVSTTYVPELSFEESGDVLPAVAHVGITKSAGYHFNNFDSFIYHFYETSPYNARADYQNTKLSDKVAFSLDINYMYDDLKTDGSFYNPNIDGFSTPFYEDKLKKSMFVIFGEDKGKEIYAYVFTLYMDKRNNQDKYNDTTVVKIIDDVQIDFVSDFSGIASFDFSYIK